MTDGASTDAQNEDWSSFTEWLKRQTPKQHGGILAWLLQRRSESDNELVTLAIEAAIYPIFWLKSLEKRRKLRSPDQITLALREAESALKAEEDDTASATALGETSSSTASESVANDTIERKTDPHSTSRLDDSVAPSSTNLQRTRPKDKDLKLAEKFLSIAEAKQRDRSNYLKQRQKELQKREAVLFRVLVTGGVLTLFMAILGVVLIFLQYVAVGIAVEAIAILPGVGTLSLRQMAGSIRREQEEVSADEKEALRIYEAIQYVQAIPDENKRMEEMINLSTDMRQRAERADRSRRR
jgi:hypothetical protein